MKLEHVPGGISASNITSWPVKSLQDSSTYTSRQSASGGSISFGGGKLTGGGISVGRSNIDSNYQSVNQTSGIQAGDGGFQVGVNNNTDLKGGVIASTQTAIDNHRNSFTTGGTLTTSDIQNSAEYKGEAIAVSASIGKSTDSKGNTSYLPGVGVGLGTDKGSAQSTTTAGISGIAGNTAVRTGDAQTGIVKIFDAAKVQREIDAQVQITQEFGKNAAKAVGDYAQAQLSTAKNLRVQADAVAQTDPQRADSLNAQAQQIENNWGANGTLRLAAHTLIGGLTGGASGAAGAAAGTLTAPAVDRALAAAGITGPLTSTLMALASTAVGAATGGTAGAGAALNEVANNYLNHNRPSLLALSERERYEAAVAACNSGNVSACSTRNELAALSAQRDAALRDACSGNTPELCSATVREATAMGNIVRSAGGVVYANSPVQGAIQGLNTATISTPNRPDSFHDALAMSTAEALLFETGNQVAAAVFGLAARGLSALNGSKASAAEFIPAAQQSATPLTQVDGVFATQGLNNVNPLLFPDGVKMVRVLEQTGLGTELATVEARRFIQSGSTLPVATPLDVTDKLVKIVPLGGQPSANTGYWMRESQLAVLRQDPANIANRLGLPPGMHVNAFDVYQIVPKQGAVAFESTISPTTVNGIQNTTGGARQIIVLDRSQFTVPVKVDSIKVK